MVLAETGEETIVYSGEGTYAANVERAEVLAPEPAELPALRPLTAVSTPGRRTVEEVTSFLNITPAQLVKTLLYSTGKETVAVLVRGDHAVNEIKVKRLLGATDIELLAPELVPQLTGAPVGYVGPVGLKKIRILADWAVKPTSLPFRHVKNRVPHVLPLHHEKISVNSPMFLKASYRELACRRCVAYPRRIAAVHTAQSPRRARNTLSAESF